MLRFRSLGSGSSGNATVVEATGGHQVTRLLIDCGLSLRELDRRLQRAGLDATDLDAVFITHEHSDHIGCAQALALRQRLPVWMSHGTHAAIGTPDFDGLLRRATDATAIDLGALQVMPFTVPHDAREPLQLTCTDGATRLGVLTDLGHATAHVMQHLAGCHALLIEANHDAGLLAASAYPSFLKKRVGGAWGHLENTRTADILRGLHHCGLRRVVAAHLSERNNRANLVQTLLGATLNCAPEEIGVAHPLDGTAWESV